MSYVAPPPGTAVEIQRTAPHVVTERGVIIHSAMSWLVAYFPGDPQRPADPADTTSIRVVRTADVTAYRDLADCEPEWVVRTWNHLAQAGPGHLQASQAVRLWELAATLAQHRLNADVALVITQEQLERWAGRLLNGDDLDRLDEAIPRSSIPSAIGEIVSGMDSPDSE
jgi:hypothetical protein